MTPNLEEKYFFDKWIAQDVFIDPCLDDVSEHISQVLYYAHIHWKINHIENKKKKNWEKLIILYINEDLKNILEVYHRKVTSGIFN